ncbi:bifunctional 2-methylcitrate synthase/citrate synthase [Frondihabitans sp. VKM Ac-2883]|uniref:bifunctional 2-methylcitrate synthase/citrate synthase n=1 Tax=Frondihabitans sp. VKM Ac-2883 TaxID=2783823 RepID=UPI00188A2343|nr:bifunctional 2-methylcitrate synthase/citrate synthase [Frondihabitans sp. VKM Ac-2883]MBF4574760.1 bifunctional 2-methylcitrate synthase/citrate synthase [Frondihabitans sp. VKM Ac-2883]
MTTSAATDTAPEIHKGLNGVVVDETRVSKVDAASNSLLYRGYPVQQLAGAVPFEDVVWLLWRGELPTASEKEAFRSAERGARALDPTLRSLIDSLPKSTHPMDVLRTAVSALGTLDPEPAKPSPDETYERALRVFAQIPALIAYDQRRRRGQDPVDSRDDLGYSANFLWLVFGEEPDPRDVEAFDVSMTLYAEHSFNASTFTARVIASTLSDLHSALVGAIGALRGPLHGGANEAALALLEEIHDPDRVDAWLDAALAEKRTLMGFGHRVYKNGDSRVPTMEVALGRLLDERPGQENERLRDLYDALQQGVLERKGLKPNVDYPSGVAYHLLGFDAEVFTPLFVAARVAGWTAHVVEQRGANALIRPLSEYVGKGYRDVPVP